MIKVGILGHVADGKDIFDGQTVKTREIISELEKDKDISVDIYDTYYLKDAKYKLLFDLYRMFSRNEIIIICLSWNGYHKILPLLYLFNKIFRRRLFDFVIGGCRHRNLAENKGLIKYVLDFEMVYVESYKMVDGYKQIGLNNVEYMPNFKNLEVCTEIVEKDTKILKLCTFSRICKEKGIEDAIQAVHGVNNTGNDIKCTLTIYGAPDDGYQETFEQLKNNFPEYIRYGGLVKYSDSSKVLKDYDILLFPTYHEGEGFPGTLLDAYAAGLAIIATDWSFNSELVTDKENGFIVPIKDVVQLSDKIQNLYENRKLLHYMKNNSLQKAKKYLTHNVLRSFMDRVKDNA